MPRTPSTRAHSGIAAEVRLPEGFSVCIEALLLKIPAIITAHAQGGHAARPIDGRDDELGRQGHGHLTFKTVRRRERDHGVEKTGLELRKLMSWIDDKQV